VTSERRALAFDEVPDALAACHVGLSPWRTDMGVGLLGAMPTKIGEFLAAGRPVVVNPGLGDMDRIIEVFDCGVVVGGSDDDALDAAGRELDRLLADPTTP
jgi:glycosyltransferase involved in cell wall biosynthesis